ncbi:uncharacterized protein LOC116849973 [Odontomachus brunneus]|uniref:uncharacterized protein LOC116849973 n=1 Tax=Odontomachus brunneus TaxID=486640 RepID=UPI0013F1B3EF|nr:uncharacterized protein LOC116849973 [Odontomachus brunneus]
MRLLLNFSLLLLYTMGVPMDHDRFLDNDYGGITQKDLQKMHFTFSCEGRLPGFYADVKHNCEIFHVCAENGDSTPVLCPFQTLFDQRQSMCTDEEVPCVQSEQWYYLDDKNYYTYFMESKNKAETVLEEIEVDTVRPLESN